MARGQTLETAPVLVYARSVIPVLESLAAQKGAATGSVKAGARGTLSVPLMLNGQVEVHIWKEK